MDPNPGVATARKSRGRPPKHFIIARRCQPRNTWLLTDSMDTAPPE
jgi:hypothetical protein